LCAGGGGGALDEGTGLPSAVLGTLGIVTFRGMQQLKAMALQLRPVGSWKTPFRRASRMSRPYLIWAAIWCGGSWLPSSTRCARHVLNREAGSGGQRGEDADGELTGPQPAIEKKLRGQVYYLL